MRLDTVWRFRLVDCQRWFACPDSGLPAKPVKNCMTHFTEGYTRGILMGVLEDSLEDLLKGILKGILKSLLCRLYQVIFHTPVRIACLAVVARPEAPTGQS